ncbi:MAG: hypothetical protein JJE17_00135 [Peptostreptococcaceae bacterium]|nr:hypothetical protein [Peptostreptococcaceae bacterium]
MDVRIKIQQVFDNKKCMNIIEYCKNCSYGYVDELTKADYIAFKSKYNLETYEIRMLKEIIDQNINGINLGIKTIEPFSLVNNTTNIQTGNIEDQKIDRMKKNQESYKTNTFCNNALEASKENNIDVEINYQNLKLVIKEKAKNKNGNENPLLTEEVKFNEDYLDTGMLSTRSRNALFKAKITTLPQMLNLDRGQLNRIRDLGVKSIEEIIKIQTEINQRETSSIKVVNPSIVNKSISTVPRDTMNILLEEGIDFAKILSSYSENPEYVVINSVVDSIGIIGKDMSYNAYNNPEYIKQIQVALEEYNINFKSRQKLYKIYSEIPNDRKKRKLKYYLDSFRSKKLIQAILPLSDLLINLELVSDLNKIFYDVSKEKDMYIALCIILEELTIDFKNNFISTLESFSKIEKHERMNEVIISRCQGLSLQEIGEQRGVSRERIRQIEVKANKKLFYLIFSIGIDPIMFISAERNGDMVITQDEIREYFDDCDNISLILYLLKLENISNLYIYDKKFTAFRLKGINHEMCNSSKLLEGLPTFIKQSEIEIVLNEVSEKRLEDIEIIEMAFCDLYKLYGQVYCRGRLVLSQVYDFILGEYYPHGIKLYDDNQISQFRKKTNSIFGDINLPTNNRAIESRLINISVLCNRGKYIHSKYIRVEMELVQAIENYVNNSKRIAISFNELFEMFKEQLMVSSNINNKYFLQGVTKYYLSNKYYITKDFISKEKGVSVYDEIEKYILERGEIHKSKISNHFAGITEAMLSINLSLNKNIIFMNNGYYMHTKHLNINEKDYEINKVLRFNTLQLPISSRKLLELLWMAHSEFLIRNNITENGKLFGILKYMFEDEFVFSRPYIARIGSEDLTNISVIKQHITNYKRISVSDLLLICAENHLLFVSIRQMIKSFNSDFLRTDADLLERVDFDEFTQQIIEEIANAIFDNISLKGYVVGFKIESFLFYPEIPFSWNAFVLRSIVEKYLENEIQIIDIPTTDTFAMNTIFVDSTLNYENYEELIKNVLINEHKANPFVSIEDAFEWIKTAGLILNENSKSWLESNIIALLKLS